MSCTHTYCICIINASEKGYTYNINLTGTPEAWSSRLPVHNGRRLSASHEAWVSSRGAVACGVGGASLLPGPAAHWDRRLWLCHVSFGRRWGDEWRRCLCAVVVGVIWCCGCVVCVCVRVYGVGLDAFWLLCDVLLLGSTAWRMFVTAES